MADVYIRTPACEYEHPHHTDLLYRTGRVPLDCTEFIRPADGCTWGDCTRPSTTRSTQRQTKGRLLCDRCLRVARICGLD